MCEEKMGKKTDRQEDLLELFNASIDWQWTLETSQSKYSEGVQSESKYKQ